MHRIASRLFDDFIDAFSRATEQRLSAFHEGHDYEEALADWHGFPRRAPFYVKTLKCWTELPPELCVELVGRVEAWALPPFLGMSRSKFLMPQETVFAYLGLLESLWALVSADFLWHLLLACTSSAVRSRPEFWRNLLISGKSACTMPSREEENRAWFPLSSHTSMMARVQWSAVFGLLSSRSGSGPAIDENSSFFNFISSSLFPSMDASHYTLSEAYTSSLLCASLTLPIQEDARMSMRMVILLSKILSITPNPNSNHSMVVMLLKTLDRLLVQFDFPRLLSLSATSRIPRTSTSQWELFFEETVAHRVLKCAEAHAKVEKLKPTALHLMCTVLFLAPLRVRKHQFARFMQHRVFRHLNEQKKLKHTLQIVHHAIWLQCGKRASNVAWDALSPMRTSELGEELGNDAEEFVEVCFAEVLERGKSRVLNSLPMLGRMHRLLSSERERRWGEEVVQEFHPAEDLSAQVLQLVREMARNSPTLLKERMLPSLMQVDEAYKASASVVRKAVLGLVVVNEMVASCRGHEPTVSRVEEICHGCKSVVELLGHAAWPLIATRVHVRRCGPDGNDCTGFLLGKEFNWAETANDRGEMDLEEAFDAFHYRTAAMFLPAPEETPAAWTVAGPSCDFDRRSTGLKQQIGHSTDEVLLRCRRHGLKPDRVLHTLAIAYEAFPALALLSMSGKISSTAHLLVRLLTHVDWGLATTASHSLQRMLLCAEDELQRALVVAALVDEVERGMVSNLDNLLLAHMCDMQTLLQQLLLLLNVWKGQRQLAPLPADGTEQIVREEWTLRVPAIAAALHIYPLATFHRAAYDILDLFSEIVSSLPFQVEWTQCSIKEYLPVRRSTSQNPDSVMSGGFNSYLKVNQAEHIFVADALNDKPGGEQQESQGEPPYKLDPPDIDENKANGNENDAARLVALLQKLQTKNSDVVGPLLELLRQWKRALDPCIRAVLNEDPPVSVENDALLRLHWRVLASLVCLEQNPIDEGLLFQCWDLAVDCRQRLVSVGAWANYLDSSRTSDHFSLHLLRGLDILLGVAAKGPLVNTYVKLVVDWRSAEEVSSSDAPIADDPGHRFLVKILKRGGNKAAMEQIEATERGFAVGVEAMVVLRHVVDKLDVDLSENEKVAAKEIQRLIARIEVERFQAAGVAIAQAFAELLAAVAGWLVRVALAMPGRSKEDVHGDADELWKRAERRKAWRLLQRLSGFSDIPVGFQKDDAEDGGETHARGSLKKLKISTREYTLLQKSVSDAACKLLRLGPVSLGDVPAPPEAWLWSWFYSDWSVLISQESCSKRPPFPTESQCERRALSKENDLKVVREAGGNLRNFIGKTLPEGLFCAYLQAHWRIDDEDTWITFQAYLDEYYKNEAARRSAEARVLFNAIAASLFTSTRQNRRLTQSNEEVCGKLVFLALVQYRAGKSLDLRQQAVVVLQRLVGSSPALGRYAEDLGDLGLIRKNTEQMAAQVYQVCSSEVKLCIYAELCERLPQLCVGGRAQDAVETVVPLLQSYALPTSESSAGIGVSDKCDQTEGKEDEAFALSLSQLWGSLEECRASLNDSELANLAIPLITLSTARRSSVVTVLRFLIQQVGDTNDTVISYALAADFVEKCSLHLLTKFPDEVVRALLPFLGCGDRPGCAGANWKRFVITKRRRAVCREINVPCNNAVIQSLCSCLKRDPWSVTEALPVLTAYCLCCTTGGDNAEFEGPQKMASSPEKTLVHAIQWASMLHGAANTGSNAKCAVQLQGLRAFTQLCSVLDAEDTLPQMLCQALFVRLVSSQKPEEQLRALKSIIALRTVYKTSSDVEAGWVQLESSCVLQTMLQNLVEGNNELVDVCFRFLNDLYSLCKHLGENAMGLTAAVECAVTLLNASGPTLIDSVEGPLLRFLTRILQDESFHGYVPPLSTVHRLLKTQICELQSFSSAKGLELTKAMIELGNLHDELKGYSVVMVYIAALSCGKQFHVLKDAVGSLGSDCFGLDEEVEPIIVVVERLIDCYNSRVVKDILKLSCDCDVPKVSSAWMESVLQIAIALVQLESSDGLVPIFRFSLNVQARQDLARYDLDWLHTRETAKQFNDILAENAAAFNSDDARSTSSKVDAIKCIDQVLRNERETLRQLFGVEDAVEGEEGEEKMEPWGNHTFITNRKKLKKANVSEASCEQKNRTTGSSSRKELAAAMIAGVSTFDEVKLGKRPNREEWTSPVYEEVVSIPTPYELCTTGCVNVLEENEIIKLLRHDVISNALVSFMRTNRLNTSWVEFARECLWFSCSPTLDKAIEIKQKFVRLDALDTLPIDRMVRGNILQSTSVERTLFDDVLVKAIEYIKENAYSQFLRSRFFTDLVD